MPPIPEAPVSTEVEVIHKDVRDLFSRGINSSAPIRSLTLKRVLTRPLVAMSHRKQLAVEVQSDMYLMDLPLTGRGGGTGATRVFDALELVPTETGFKDGDECVVVCNEIMCSSLAKNGWQSMKAITDKDGVTTYQKVDGRPLKGALLGFISGDIVDGKRYRAISVAELE